jgi:hypothetical protein
MHLCVAWSFWPRANLLTQWPGFQPRALGAAGGAEVADDGSCGLCHRAFGGSEDRDAVELVGVALKAVSQGLAEGHAQFGADVDLGDPAASRQ